MKDEFRKRFKQELGKFIKLKIFLPVAFGAVWHQMAQTIWLAETDSAPLFQELISWAKKMFPSLNKAADRRRSNSRDETIVLAFAGRGQSSLANVLSRTVSTMNSPAGKY